MNQILMWLKRWNPIYQNLERSQSFFASLLSRVRGYVFSLHWSNVLYEIEMVKKDRTGNQYIREGLCFWYGGRFVRNERLTLCPSKGFFYLDVRELNRFGKFCLGFGYFLKKGYRWILLRR